ncbi:MAG: ArnT family glycosyltransferase [Bacteroidia bacterium]
MSVFLTTYFNRIFWVIASLVFVVICLRAFFIPFTHDEAATFFYYIQSDNYLPYKAHVYTNNHVLNSALSNLCYHIAGPHRFILRLPNILSFILLCFGIYRHFPYLKNTSSKILLACAFLFTFNFLDFFELCRGYGLSMGCLLLALSYLADYFSTGRIKTLVLFSIFLQLALAANLILVVMSTVLLFFIYVYQLKRKLLFRPLNLILQAANLLLLIFWIKFSFFYKAAGALDYGVGENYWEVTFKTLLKFLYSTDGIWIQCVVLFLFTLVLTLTFITARKDFTFTSLFTPKNFYPLMLIILIAGFYLQKKMLDVNFPEDRTGIFFFLLFVLSISFSLDGFKKLSDSISVSIITPLFIYFILSLNISFFSSNFYYTMPKELYLQLKKEFNDHPQLFTIGGNRARELNYAFLNYKGELNTMDDSAEMQMNCDYYFAMKIEKPYYEKYYEEIGYDNKWDRVLLKRKEKIEHEQFYVLNNFNYSGADEFIGLKQIQDTVFENHNPVELYTEINFVEVPKPWNAFLVLEINNDKGEQIWYKRVPITWLDNDLNNKTRHLKLSSGNLPPKSTIKAYFWNIDKQKVTLMINNLQLYQLNGKGVDFRIPGEYYLMMYNFTKKPLI